MARCDCSARGAAHTWAAPARTPADRGRGVLSRRTSSLGTCSASVCLDVPGAAHTWVGGQSRTRAMAHWARTRVLPVGNGRAGPGVPADSLGVQEGGAIAPRSPLGHPTPPRRGVGRGIGQWPHLSSWSHRAMLAPGAPLMRGGSFSAQASELHVGLATGCGRGGQGPSLRARRHSARSRMLGANSARRGIRRVAGC